MENLKKSILRILEEESDKTLVLTKPAKISEELKYHIDNKLSLTNNVFRAYSKKYFDLINEVRELWEKGKIKLNEEDTLMVESDTGKVAFYMGKEVYLDAPILIESKTKLTDSQHRKILSKMNNEQLKKLSDYGYELVDKFIGETHNMLLLYNDEDGIFEVSLTNENEQRKINESKSLRDNKVLGNKIKEWLLEYGDLIFESSDGEMVDNYKGILENQGFDISDIEMGSKSYFLTIYADDYINEAEYKGKKVNLNKPFRTSGGPKKFAVYVKNPKTGNVKKVSFGDPNLKVRNRNPKAAKSFRARHKCSQKKDRTTAGYWSCSVGRYAKQLGLSSKNAW
jgi:hypothetical protein